MHVYETTHERYTGSARKLNAVPDDSIALVVTSPPYPMIEMWDESLGRQDPQIERALAEGRGMDAFDRMHELLDSVWAELYRVVQPGGFVCLNVGDATRSLNGSFALYPNHVRITTAFLKLGFQNLPNILWRKQTNAPNKFMGSGMLPAGAYVTLEHEWILIFKKPGKRRFVSNAEKQLRRRSAYFWEERNLWFSDLWEIKGTRQDMNDPETRKRSAAYPLEIPYRLILMFSLQEDRVLDPFLGAGTTTLAALATQRSSIGYEIDPGLSDFFAKTLESLNLNSLNSLTGNRLVRHAEFIQKRRQDPTKTDAKHFNKHLNTPVMTAQETDIQLFNLESLQRQHEQFTARYQVLAHFWSG